MTIHELQLRLIELYNSKEVSEEDFNIINKWLEVIKIEIRKSE